MTDITTQKMIEDMLWLDSRGESWADICGHFHIRPRTIHRILVRHQLPIPGGLESEICRREAQPRRSHHRMIKGA